jgi:hypothetical protein
MYTSSVVSGGINDQRQISGADTRVVLGSFTDTMRDLVKWLANPSEEDMQLPGLNVPLSEKDIGSVFFTTALGLWTNDMNSVIETISNFESFKTELFNRIGQMATS